MAHVREGPLRGVKKSAEERARVQGGVNPPHGSSSGFSLFLGWGGLTPPSSHKYFRAGGG